VCARPLFRQGVGTLSARWGDADGRCRHGARRALLAHATALRFPPLAGAVRLVSPELRLALQSAVLDAVADNSMPLLAVRTGSVAAFVGDSFPESLVLHALGTLGRQHPTEAGRWCISPRRAARALGSQLLQLIRDRTGAATTGVRRPRGASASGRRGLAEGASAAAAARQAAEPW